MGLDESLSQGFFAARIAREEDPALLVACDSTTIDSDTRNPEARDGTGKSHTGRRATRLLVLYSMASRRPLAYAKQPGNVPDVVSLENAARWLEALCARRVMIASDVGFAFVGNLGAILHSGSHVLTKARVGWKWVSEQVDAHLRELDDPGRIMDRDVLVRGTTVALTREFPLERACGSKAKGPEAGDTDHVRRRIYLHIYRDQARRDEQDRALWRELKEVESLIVEGIPLDGHAEGVRDEYLDVRRRGKKVTVSWRKDAVDEACRLHGVFALASDKVGDADRALEIYRERERVEDLDERLEQDAGGHTARTGDPESLNGRLLTQFLAMCYIEGLHERIRQMKASLGRPNGDASHDTDGNLEDERRLRRWLEKRSLWRTLTWFDAHETIEVSTDIRKRRWNTETVKRDRLFLRLLGVEKGGD